MKVVHNEEQKVIQFLDERFYFHSQTGKYYPSATTILDVYPKGYGYIQWLKDLGSNSEEVIRRAQDQGTNIHNGIEMFFTGNELKWLNEKTGEENYTLEEWKMLLRFYDFYKTYKPTILGVEVSLVSPRLGFGGTLDFICKLPDYPKDVFYMDWKSGARIYKTNKIQASSYVKLWNLLIKEHKITRTGCMHLRASTKGPAKDKIQGEGWKFDEVKDIDHNFKLFQHAQAVWNEENPNPKPKNMVYTDRISIREVNK